MENASSPTSRVPITFNSYNTIQICKYSPFRYSLRQFLNCKPLKTNYLLPIYSCTEHPHMKIINGRRAGTDGHEESTERPRPAASCPAVRTHDGIIWDPKGLSCSAISQLHDVSSAFFDDYPMVQASPASRGLHCNLNFTFKSPYNGLQGSPCRNPTLSHVAGLLSSLKPWCRPPAALIIASFMYTEPAACGWHCQGLLPTWSAAWLL